MVNRRLYYDDGRSRKFWVIQQRGKTHTIQHGKMGTPGKELQKQFDSSSEASAEAKSLIEKKKKKGYVEVDPTRLKVARPAGKRKATEKQVANLEEHLGMKLPLEYRRFLLTQNGGVPDPYFIRIPGLPSIDNVAVGFLLGLYGKCEPWQSLIQVMNRMSFYLPAGQLPIAGDSDLFTLSLKSKPGCVYFWDHEAPNVEDEDESGNGIYKMSHAYLIAGSFDEFLTRIATYKASVSLSRSGTCA